MGAGGAKSKFRDNIEALHVLKRIEAEGRHATTAEQSKIVKYVGWGGLPQAFDPRNEDWAKEFAELSSMLSKDEYEAARRSTQDAHYTPDFVVESIYAGLSRLGFNKGRALDPALGTGHFIGLMPAEMSRQISITGIELDNLTARIANTLYPESSIINKGYQEVIIPKNHFDVVVGNFPFGNQSVYDERLPDLSKFSIHNYFAAKSIDHIKPGGLIAMVVSSYFMDGQDTKAREFIAGKAHLVGAIRLPHSTFKQNALTEVTTDIVFLRKALEGETIDKSWVETTPEFDLEAKARFNLNNYYVANRDKMLGTMKMVNLSFRGGTPALVANDDLDLKAALASAIEQLPVGIYTTVDQVIDQVQVQEKMDVPDVKIGAYFLVRTLNGQPIEPTRIARRLPDVLSERSFEWIEARSEQMAERIRGLVEIRTVLRSLMDAEKQEHITGEQLEGHRQALNTVYDRFQKKSGFISSLVMKQAMGDDPEFPLLLALERDYDKGISKEQAKKHGVEAREPSARKAAIFSKRVMSPLRDIEHVDTAKEALVVSMNELGRVDLQRMARLTKKTESTLLEELAGLVYLNPINRRFETAEAYLSGNVKKKLAEAHKAAIDSPRFIENVQALEQVQPKDIEPVDISVQLGSSWVPDEVVSQFVAHLLGDVRRDVNYQAALGKWIVKISAPDRVTNHVTWGTDDIGGNTLIEKILTNKPIEVKDMVGYDEYRNPIYKLNESKTAAATQKADEIKQAFEDWIWEDKDRRVTLARIYNDQFNTNVPTKYDGSHLVLPGASLSVSLRPHQKNVIWRGIQDGTALYDHVVGAGKTFEFIGTGIEMKRMGLLKKPMYVVPNHLLGQWKDAFYELYPSANILVAEKSDFKKENRQRLFGRIATGDWDAVIVAHSSFKKIGVPQETLEIILNEQIDDLTFAIQDLKRNNGQHFSIKELEKTKDRMEARLKRAADTGRKDEVANFDDLGVDALFVDESQEFKNLFITTTMSRVSGLGNLEGSEKAFDLFVKARYLQMKHDGRGLFFGTGTPVSNTIAEVYTVQRYMQYDEMKERGIVHFDAWASTFGKVVTGWELDATGVNYRLNSRFAKFQNVPELTAMYRSFADVITRADLERQAEEIGKRFPTPKIKGGKPQNIIVPRSSMQAEYMGLQRDMLDGEGKPMLKADGLPLKEWTPGSIIHRMENLPDDPSKDNPLKITNDARKAGLDFRLIDPNAPDDANSKVNELVNRVHDIWAQWDSRKGTQLVFCDLSTPKSHSQNIVAAAPIDQEAEAEETEAISMDELLSSGGKFSVYEDIRDKLVAMGIPAHQIRFIHDAKTDLQKSKLFDEMNRGVARILLGSTAKMGAGTNVQKKLVAEHHLDAPWRPSDLEQREGRIIRQGNEFYEEDPDGFEVQLLRYATEKTYDGRMWQTIEVKASGIEQFRKGDALQRVIEDISSEAANAAEMKAAATGNPLIFMQVQLSADLKKMEAIYAGYKRSQHTLDSRIDWLSGSETRTASVIEKYTKEIERRDAHSSDEFRLTIGSKVYGEKDKKQALAEILNHMKTALQHKQPKGTQHPTVHPVGQYRGFDISVYATGEKLQFVIDGEDSYEPHNLEYHKEDEFSLTGFVTRINKNLDVFEERIHLARERLNHDLAELQKALAEHGKAFPQMEKLEILRQDNGDVLAELKKLQADDAYISTWQPRSYQAQKAGQPSQDTVVSIPEPIVEQPQAFSFEKLATDLGKEIIQVNTEFGIYRGTVIEKSEGHIVQSVGKKYIVIHAINNAQTAPQIGEVMEIRYRNNVMQFQAKESSHEHNHSTR
ncbi:N-6 DNA methylase (plasmid) [Methylovorus glucosotrophus SIP3-4]|uniref:N-6 DNA methylase n=1 Tax=Methylovorus glucosotrophus (strain SIP3-4) TaxID=582744 RepID=C6XEQ1_METGS|nr:N-6 DNA methylase [Methylovorus glucosotrophus SIP3-4]